jgi:dTDP-glucose 4,6-dehydratase
VYNVGGHNERDNLAVVKTILGILGKPESLIAHVPDRAGHDLRYAIDPTKITDELGWIPETDFDTGIVKTIRWYLEHQDWVEEILQGDYVNYYNRMYNTLLKIEN